MKAEEKGESEDKDEGKEEEDGLTTKLYRRVEGLRRAGEKAKEKGTSDEKMSEIINKYC